jgi:hypothetical protein
VLAAKLPLGTDAQRRFEVTLRHAFRAISAAALMAALLLLYYIHPIAGWTTLAVLFIGTIVARRRKVDVALGE